MKNPKITSIEGERKKQLIKIGLIVVAVFVLIYLLVKFTDNKRSQVREKNEIAENIKKGNFSGTAMETEQDVWIAKSEEKLKALEDQNRRINLQLKELTETIKQKESRSTHTNSFPVIQQPDNSLLITKPIDDKPVKHLPAPGIKRFSFRQMISLSSTKITGYLQEVSCPGYCYPLPMHPEAYQKSVAIWCSEDKVTTLETLLSAKQADEKTCETPIDQNMQLASELGISATPTMILDTGEMIAGFVTASELKKRMGIDE